MALEGSLTDFGLADILQLIYFQRKTGVLTLTGRMDRIRLLFVEGKITGAESKRRTDDNRLGKILLKKGFIKEDDLQAILEEQKKTDAKIGILLIRKGLVEQAIIHEILTSQISETVIQLFGWKQGTYEFTAQGIPLDKELDLSLDTQQLLMDGLRIVDEWTLIKGKIAFDTLFNRTNAEDMQLNEDEKEILSYVDGENDVSTIIDLAGRDNFLVSKTLLSLLDKGIIEIIEPVIVSDEIDALDVADRWNLIKYLTPGAMLISLLLSVVAMLLQPQGAYYREYRASVKIGELRAGIETYKIEHGTYPAVLDAISVSRDPWQRPYIYRVADQSFILLSLGADGKEGTADDVY